MLTESEKQQIRDKLLADGYGITLTGCNIKRLDTLLSEVNSELSTNFGFNTSDNPKSFFNVITTAFTNKIAELWELGQMVYDSFNPATAEGVSLDNILLLGGSSREQALPTVYPIHVEIQELNYPNGTILPATTKIKSNTNPAIGFTITKEENISRNSCNMAKIVVTSLVQNATYTVTVNGVVYTSENTGQQPTAAGLYASLREKINEDTNAVVFAETPESGNYLWIYDKNIFHTTSITLDENGNFDTDKTLNNFTLALDNKLTTQTITSIINFNTDENGVFDLPHNTITQIVTEFPGFLSVHNIQQPIEGQLIEDDVSARKSYLDKIFARSSRMTDSIRSKLLTDIERITWCAVNENDGDTPIYDTDNTTILMTPHSIWVIVEVGNSGDLTDDIKKQIADIIFNVKSA